MVKSGVIFGVITFVLVIVSSLLSPLCAPCLGLLLGLGAGYIGGAFAKPVDSSNSLRMGGIAGVIAGSIGFVGGLIGGVINGTMVSASAVEQFYRAFGITNVSVSQSQLLAYQLIGAGCIGLFDVVWMGILGLAGGALWFQFRGKDQTTTVLPPQEPIPPSY